MRTNIEKIVRIEQATIGNADRILFKNFNLAVDTGKRIGITGPSGCGKTTLLRKIVSRGKGISYRLFEINTDRIGYVPQQHSLMPWYNLQANLEVVQYGADFDEILRTVEASDLKLKYPSQMSGGELQRSKLAFAMSINPKLYCVDEPLTEVSLKQKWRIAEKWSIKMAVDNAALILVSHEIDLLLFLCDEVLIVDVNEDGFAEVQSILKIDATNPRTISFLNHEEFLTKRKEMTNALYV